MKIIKILMKKKKMNMDIKMNMKIKMNLMKIQIENPKKRWKI